MKQQSGQMAEDILDLSDYHSMAAALQKIQQQQSNRFEQVAKQLKELLILHPEPIYTLHTHLTVDVLKMVRDIFKLENNVDQKYFEVNSGYLLIAVAEGFLLQNLPADKLSKVKQFFARKIQKNPSIWGLDQLQNLQAYLIDSRTGLFPQASPIHRSREIDKFTYLFSFYQHYYEVFPQLFDISTIFFKMMLCLREEKEKDKQLLAMLRQKYLGNRYHLQTTIKNMKFALQFFKHSFNEKDCAYYPQKSLISILNNYSQQQVQNILKVTSVGSQWQQAQINEYFINCIKLGFLQAPKKMMVAMIKFCERSGKFNQLLYIYENNIKRVFIFMKHKIFFSGCLEILKYFILSPPPTLSLFEKFLPEAAVFMSKVEPQFKYPFLNVLQVVAHAYRESASMQQLNKIISDNIGEGINLLPEEERNKMLVQYSWKQKINLKTLGQNVIESNKAKSAYKGLTNIGNSCYMNSFLQALFMNREFLKQIIKSSTLEIRAEKLKDKKLQGKSKEFIQAEIQNCVKPFAELQRIFALLLKSIRTQISPLSIRQVAPQMFRNSNQHDTIQFGRTFLDIIFRNNIPPMFEGEVTTEILCKECGKSRHRKQAFLDYHISSQSGQLQQLIDSSFKQQMVQDLTCDFCNIKGKESIKHHFISKFPNYLILSINRFEYDIAEKRNKKNKSKIVLNPLLKINNNQYQIYSIIIHTGPSPNAGHYFTFSKTKYDDNCKWVCHNDSLISEFQNFGQVNNFLQNSQEDTPYILFYESKQHIDKSKQELCKPIILREPQQNFVRKDNESYLSTQKKTKFQLQPINYNYFMKRDDEDDNNQDRGGFYNSYIS